MPLYPRPAGQFSEKPRIRGRDDLLNQIGLAIEQGDDGVVVTGVVGDSPADAANMRRGDIILEVNRRSVREANDVIEALEKTKNAIAVFYIDRNVTEEQKRQALEGLDEYDLGKLKLLNEPNELFVVQVGDAALGSFKPQVALEANPDVREALERVVRELNASGVLPEYTI